MSTQSLSRRDFVKGAALAAALGGVALAGSTQPSVALATAYVGDGDLSGNVYVAKSDHGFPQVSGNAYLTNATTPSNPLTGPFPTEAASGNVTDYTVNSDGSVTATIDLLNTMFRLVSIPATSDDGGATATVTATDANGYVSQLSVTVASYGTDYVFSDAVEYAGFSIFAGKKYWPIHVVVTEA